MPISSPNFEINDLRFTRIDISKMDASSGRRRRVGCRRRRSTTLTFPESSVQCAFTRLAVLDNSAIFEKKKLAKVLEIVVLWFGELACQVDNLAKPNCRFQKFGRQSTRQCRVWRHPIDYLGLRLWNAKTEAVQLDRPDSAHVPLEN